ncbi:MAG: molybdopterin molybdotransferase MoeA [Planctomycetota bacterium]|jgi:molybdenum cofactor synthesis domain-containing protein
MLSPQEALKIVLAHVEPIGTERVPIEAALRRCLAEDVLADRDLPTMDRSAMDGYAIRARDVNRLPCRLTLVGEVAAGSSGRPQVRPSSCVSIMTGANLPPGADTVVMVEATRASGDAVTILDAPVARGNVLRRGSITRRGQVVVAAGTILGATEIGVCAAVGEAKPRVFRRPSVGLISTGREIREAGAEVGPHEIRNSNGPALRAALVSWGFPDVSANAVADDVEETVACLRSMLARHEVVILTGGVSVGKYDFVRQAVESVGGAVRFHKVAMKPGKPVLYATAEGGRHIFGLPGNPQSCFVGFHEFVLPALRRLAGIRTEECHPTLSLRTIASLPPHRERWRFALARLVRGAEGLSAEPVRSTGSADLVAGSRADGVIPVPPRAGGVPAGATVEFHSWRPVL